MLARLYVFIAKMSFDSDLKDLHLLYDYDVTLEDGKHEKWRYEIWFSHEVSFHSEPEQREINSQKYNRRG